ncbi:MAG: class I SAM-dependent methyltransferase [Deltaproteobacteria bacterium]
MNCSICNSQKCNSYLNLYDDRYGFEGNFLLFKCSNCKHKFLNANFSPEQITQLYTKYYPRANFDIDRYLPYKEVKGIKAWLNGEYSSAFRWVPQNVSILDIGCGFGESLGYHHSRGCDAYGIEADENILKVAERFGYNIKVGVFEAEQYETDFFDYVTLDQVIEHVANPVEFLKDIATVLKPGGVVIISTPNSEGWGARIFGKYWINWHTPYHIQFFSIISIENVAKQAGLSLEKVKTITNSEWLFYQWIHLLTRPNEGQPSAFWTYSKKLSLKKKIIIKFFSLIHKTKVNHLITRLFDAFGIGDNYLFMLRKKG